MKKIYCFNNGGMPGLYSIMAICEDGHVLAQHASSTNSWGMHDIGITSDWKHDRYREHCPDGYELEWVVKPKKHEGLMAAYKLNQELGKAAKRKVEA